MLCDVLGWAWLDVDSALDRGLLAVYINIASIPSLLTDFKISNFVTFSYSGSMKDNREVFYLHTK